MNVRKTGGRTELDVYANCIRGLMYRLLHSIEKDAAILDGTTAGKLKTTVAVIPQIDGYANASLAGTDDFWDLSAETDTIAAQYRAYWLYVDGSNVASFVAGSNSDTEVDALRALPVLDASKAIIGVFVAGPATDFSLALIGQGTIFDRVPDGASKVEIDSDIIQVAA